MIHHLGLDDLGGLLNTINPQEDSSTDKSFEIAPAVETFVADR
jgi:hypothetical protein